MVKMDKRCQSEIKEHFKLFLLQLKFFRLRKFSSIDVRENYLRFNRIAPQDAGRYVCTASNMYGNTTKVAEVVVNSMNL